MNRLLLLLFCITATGYSQTIDFPDDNFRVRLLFHDPVIDTNGDSEIQVNEAAALSGMLRVQNGSISDLTGIEYFTNITELDCSVNDLTDLDLSNNLGLIYVNCRTNIINQLDISGNTTLAHLDCERNLLSELDVSTNTSLISLNCRENQLTNLVISGAPLEVLVCDLNQLTNLDLSTQSNLDWLYCQGNLLTELDLTSSTEITKVWCAGNSISTLNVSGLTNLTHLRCNNNALTNLDLSDQINLFELWCQNNSISNIDISNSLSLFDIWCGNNQLTELTIVSDNFRKLKASGNLLTSLNLSVGSGPFQQEIEVENNQLVNLDLSDTKIRYLKCGNNSNLEYINLRNGRNWQFNYSGSSFQNLPLLSEVCLDSHGSNHVMIDFIESQVGHTVTFYNNDDCSDLVLSVDEGQTMESFVITPNPTKGILKITSSSRIVEIEIYNQLGQLVLSKSNESYVDISRFSGGLYFVKVKDVNGNTDTKKVVKQ
jgi:hypothetical protein